MRAVFTAFVAVVVLSAAVTISAQASQSSRAVKPAPAAAKAAPAKKVASHSTAGTVKSIDATTLVITHGKKDMTFAVNSSTEKAGAVESGSHVTVRYTMDGKNMVATAITAQPVKAMAAKTSTAKPAAKK